MAACRDELAAVRSGGHKKEQFVVDESRREEAAKNAETAARDLFLFDPTRPEPMYLLGLAASLRGDRLLAQKLFRSALALDPSYEPARELLHRSVRWEGEPVAETLWGLLRHPSGGLRTPWGSSD